MKQAIDQIKLLTRIYGASLTFLESLDEGMVEAFDADALKRLDKLLTKAEDLIGDPRYTKGS
jgi:hypothetical protein